MRFCLVVSSFHSFPHFNPQIFLRIEVELYLERSPIRKWRATLERLVCGPGDGPQYHGTHESESAVRGLRKRFRSPLSIVGVGEKVRKVPNSKMV